MTGAWWTGAVRDVEAIVAGLAIEFQDLAKQKSQELNAAYHLLLDAAR